MSTHHGGEPYVTPQIHWPIKLLHKAYHEVLVYLPSQEDGGSIPIVPMFRKSAGSKILLMGFGLDSDAIHSPNEHYGLFNFLKGIETIPKFYEHYIRLCKELGKT